MHHEGTNKNNQHDRSKPEMAEPMMDHADNRDRHKAKAKYDSHESERSPHLFRFDVVARYHDGLDCSDAFLRSDTSIAMYANVATASNTPTAQLGNRLTP